MDNETFQSRRQKRLERLAELQGAVETLKQLAVLIDAKMQAIVQEADELRLKNLMDRLQYEAENPPESPTQK